MQVYFWGSRGSLPASITAKSIETKIFRALKASRAHNLETDEDINTFIRNQLPFAVRMSYGGNTSCVEIKGQEEYILCDSGTGLRDFGDHYMKVEKAGRKNLPKVFHIFISHLHWDHIQGFPFFTPAYIPGHRIHIYGYHAGLEKSFVNQQDEPSFPVPLNEMSADISFHILEPGKAYEIAGISVTGIKQNHPGDSYGYCFSRDGKKVIYSTDAEHKEDSEDENYEFVSFFNNADLLIFDAQYSLLAAIEAKKNWGHSSNLLGVELAVRAGVKRLCLFHSEHTYDDDALDQFLNDTRNYLNIHDSSSPLEICLAYDGLEIEI
ncbi:MAG: MBL fold metallo-hydrolase [Proteobacteria bacterium]|nr:MBL fold metallo-hydrolase [Pseudomonadota bacterium]MBU1712922.1 MBL fold metallo-hydrolase [Pseudomonadota bacterium]